MSLCKCGADMKIEGTQLVCPKCGLKRAISQQIPSQAELWQEVQELRGIKSELTQKSELLEKEKGDFEDNAKYLENALAEIYKQVGQIMVHYKRIISKHTEEE